MLHAKQSADFHFGQLPHCQHIVFTFRFDQRDIGAKYYSTLCTPNKQYTTEVSHIDEVKNRVGTGDCFMAGLIYGFTQQYEKQKVLNFATQAAIGHFQEASDYT